MNEQLKQTYERLNLSENITREELDKRFDLLLKRMRSVSAERDKQSYEEEFQAYKFILASLDQQEIQTAENLRLKKWGRFTGIARKVEHFFRMYKMHTILALIVVIVLIVAGRGIYSHVQNQKYLASLPPIDAKIMFVGNYMLTDSEAENTALEKAFIALYPKWKRVETQIVYLPVTENGSIDMNYQQKAIVQLAADPPDVLIMDETAFQWIGQQAGLRNLDVVVAAGGISSEDVRLKKAKNLESNLQEVVGLDITDTKFASGLPLDPSTMIASVLTVDEQKAKSMMEFIEQVIKEADAR